MTTPQKGKHSDGGNMGRIGNRPYWVLNLSILIRAVHQVGAAVFLTSFLLNEITSPPPLYLALAALSGIALLLTEGMRHRQIYRELSGLTVFIKLILIGAAYHGFMPTSPGILIAFLVASVGSHAPKMIRHRLLY